MRNHLLACALALLAAPADAAMLSRVGDPEVCALLAGIGREAAVMRQSGISQQQAAQRLGALIGDVLSNGEGRLAARQDTADLVGAEATGILRLVYSLPVGRDDRQRAAAVAAAGEFIFDYCMGR